MLRIIALRLGRSATSATQLSSHRSAPSGPSRTPVIGSLRHSSLWSNERSSRDDAPHVEGSGRRPSSRPASFGMNSGGSGSSGSRPGRGSGFGLARRDDDNWISASEGGSDRQSFGRIIPRSGRRGSDEGGPSRRYGRDNAESDGPIKRISRTWEAPPEDGRMTSTLLPPKTEIDIGVPLSTPKDDSNAIAGLSGTIVQDAKLDDFLDGFVHPEPEAVPEERPQISMPGTSGRNSFASYQLPTESGVLIVKNLLQENEFMPTQDIWKTGTNERKRPIPEAFQFQPDGRIRMKSVSTMREGRRPWVPPAEAPFPDHPFRSTGFLKNILLHSLEEQGLIHKTFRIRPFETEEEHQAAIRAAEKLTRKKERRAMWDQERHGEDPGMPTPMEPSSGVKVFGWALGPNEDQTGELDESKWAKAERGERAHHEGKAREAIQAANRQFIRRTRYQEIRQQDKAYRIEDEELGMASEVKKEKRRQEALDTISHYGDVTGEDISGWFEELSEDVGRADPWRPTHLQPGGVIARKSRTKNMKPKGYPIV